RRTSPACRRSAISCRPLRGGFVLQAASVKIWRTQAPSAGESCGLAFRLGTRGGRKIADCNGTQPEALEREVPIKPALPGCKSVPLSAGGYGKPRLRIGGSGVRLPPSAPVPAPPRSSRVQPRPRGEYQELAN